MADEESTPAEADEKIGNEAASRQESYADPIPPETAAAFEHELLNAGFSRDFIAKTARMRRRMYAKTGGVYLFPRSIGDKATRDRYRDNVLWMLSRSRPDLFSSGFVTKNLILCETADARRRGRVKGDVDEYNANTLLFSALMEQLIQEPAETCRKDVALSAIETCFDLASRMDLTPQEFAGLRRLFDQMRSKPGAKAKSMEDIDKIIWGLSVELRRRLPKDQQSRNNVAKTMATTIVEDLRRIGDDTVAERWESAGERADESGYATRISNALRRYMQKAGESW